MYENNKNAQYESAKEDLIEVFRYGIYKLKNNGCTMEEMNGAMKAIQENVPLSGTISDFATFYGVTEDTVKANISRKLTVKPQRKVLFPFLRFSKIVPEKWKKRNAKHL